MRMPIIQTFFQVLPVVIVTLASPTKTNGSELLSETEHLGIGQAVQIALGSNSRLLALNAEVEVMKFSPSQVRCSTGPDAFY